MTQGFGLSSMDGSILQRLRSVARGRLLQLGRRTLIEQVRTQLEPARVLEVGCGEGENLLLLCKAFPNATVTAIEPAADKRARAQHLLAGQGARVKLIEGSYLQPFKNGERFDLVLFSYTLSSLQRGWEKAVAAARTDLRPGGLIAVADYTGAPAPWVKKWFERNEIQVNGQLMPYLAARFRDPTVTVRPAYGGLWSYLLFIGANSNNGRGSKP
jgi:S-adenosylmethionine-diacylgycerolhomoserine-N-methlytransferase